MSQQQPPSQQAAPPPATPSQAPLTNQAKPANQAQPAAPAQPTQQPRFDTQQVTPVVQIDAPRPSEEVGPAEVLLGSIALIGVLIVCALITGLTVGGIFIAIRRWRDKNSPDSTEPQATRLNLSQ